MGKDTKETYRAALSPSDCSRNLLILPGKIPLHCHKPRESTGYKEDKYIKNVLTWFGEVHPLKHRAEPAGSTSSAADNHRKRNRFQA